MSIVCDDIVFLDLFADGRDAAGGDIIEKGLSHLDAEVVISPSSAYKSTPEGEIAAKKSHKKRKSVVILRRISTY